jgi:type IX secretion system PorP/SprF family membrane protein
MIKRFTIVLLFFINVLQSSAQVDPHFSQYYSFPTWLNPAMTGVINGTYRATAIYRNQWNSVMVPFSTVGFSGDIATNKNINMGINLLTQSAGDGGYKYQQANWTIAYSGVKLGKDKQHQITFGFSFGYLGRRFDPSKFQAGDQWNPGTGFDPTTPSGDTYPKTSAGVMDIGAGLSYFDGSADKKINVFAGFSASHLTQPYDPFLTSNVKGFLPVRYTFHGGAKIYASQSFSITPHLLYMTQGNASEKMAGLVGEGQVSDAVKVFGGANYRFKDALVPIVGVSFSNLSIGASYDINNSDLGKAVNGTNSFEISLTWMGGQKEGKVKYNMACPRF